MVCVSRSHGLTAPSARLRLLSGTIRSGSNSIWLPRPVQVGQAPCGLLKLKVRGSISGRLMPQTGQAKRSEKSRSRGCSRVGDVGDQHHAAAQPQRRLDRVGQPRAARLAILSPVRSCSRRLGGLITSRSTTASMVWFL